MTTRRTERWVVTALCLVGLLGLGIGLDGFARSHPAGVRAALARPAAFDGQRVTALLWTADGDGGITSAGRRVAVSGLPELAAGATVTVEGTFDAATGGLRAASVTHHRWRRVKQVWSALGLLLSAGLLAAAFRRGDNGWREREPGEHG